MDPSTASIILSVIAVISSASAHMRLHSKCHVGNILDVSVEKQFNNDLSKYSDKDPPKVKKESSNKSSETDL